MRKLIGLLTSAFLLVAVNALALDVTLQWDANTETNLGGYKIYYDTNSGAPYNGVGATNGNSPIDIPLSKDENPDPGLVQFTVLGLPSGTYWFAVTAYDNSDPPLESGYSNEVTNYEEPPDTTPPLLSNIQVPSKTYNSAVITWITDEPSNSIVQYGTLVSTWGNYTFNQLNPALVIEHSVALAELNAETIYYFRVGSTDEVGNGPSISTEVSFTTAPPPDTTPPALPTGFEILNIEVVMIPFSYTVSGLPIVLWQNNTHEQADATITIQGMPSGISVAELAIEVYDPDYSDEGRLFINDQGPISLFGPTADISTGDNLSRIIPFEVPASYFHNGENTLTFHHDTTQGFRILGITLTFR